MSQPNFQPYVALPNSERQPVPGAQEVGAVDPNELVQVSIYVRQQAAPPAGVTMSREDYAAHYGADPVDIARVEAFGRANGLTVVQSDVARRVVVLEGTVAQVTATFQVNLRRYTNQGQEFRGRTGPVMVPQDMVGIIEGVFGLDNRSQAHAHLRHLQPEAQRATPAGLTPLQLATAYDYPTAGGGHGQTIALIELGGGYRDTDLQTYFSGLGITSPKVISVGVDGAANTPAGDLNSADGEVVLDIEVAGGVAPQAQIAVYFAPNTDQGFIDAISTAVHDTQNKPTVISISWGGPENSWTTQAWQQMDQIFQQASTFGITVLCASGDSGSGDGVNDGQAHVDFPASSPNVLACGGTTLTLSGARVASETVWNDGQGATGGGVSDLFDLPTWQQNAHIPASVNDNQRVGRGVPDIAGDAAPATGLQVLVDGQQTVVGGTSAVAPLYAGLVALLNQQLGKSAGYLNPTLYQQPSVARDILDGNNALNGTPGYDAGAGWDACTGLGVVDGGKLLGILKGA